MFFVVSSAERRLLRGIAEDPDAVSRGAEKILVTLNPV